MRSGSRGCAQLTLLCGCDKALSGALKYQRRLERGKSENQFCMTVVFNALLFFTSFAAVLALLASTTAVIGWLLLKVLKKLGMIFRAIPEDKFRQFRNEHSGNVTDAGPAMTTPP